MLMPQRDWPQIIADIAAAYLDVKGRPLSSYKLGKLIDCDHRTIELIVAGSEPKYRDGERLLAIHAEFSGKNTLVR